jgi:nickel-dependent lactate racemase
LQDILAVPVDKTVGDQWQSQILAKILNKHKVILVSKLPWTVVKEMHMIPADTLKEALTVAQNIANDSNCTITVVPNGISVFF